MVIPWQGLFDRIENRGGEKMDLNKSGIYKITFSNGKHYIGMSSNIGRRMKEHKTDMNTNSSMPVHSAMLKYDYTVEILEEEQDRKKLSELEMKWIQYYNSNNKEYGYNLTAGGEGAGSGIDNHQAKFDQDSINEIYNRLINDLDTYIYELAEEYNISTEAISDINRGLRYFNSELKYPLRQPPKIEVKKGIEHHNAKMDKETLENVYELLSSSDLTLEEIANLNNCSYTSISKINRGLTYYDTEKSYPIRKEKRKTFALNKQEVAEIHELLLNSNQSLVSISKEYGVSVDTIYRLNQGKTYFQEGLIYPLRQKRSNKKAVSTILESEE